jgi:hypothetical protein
VAGQFAKAVKPQTNTIGDLIDQMNAQGLRFAPAVSGEESAYNALYQSLVVYEGNLAQMEGRAGPTAKK